MAGGWAKGQAGILYKRASPQSRVCPYLLSPTTGRKSVKCLVPYVKRVRNIHISIHIYIYIYTCVHASVHLTFLLIDSQFIQEPSIMKVISHSSWTAIIDSMWQLRSIQCRISSKLLSLARETSHRCSALSQGICYHRFPALRQETS